MLYLSWPLTAMNTVRMRAEALEHSSMHFSPSNGDSILILFTASRLFVGLAGRQSLLRNACMELLRHSNRFSHAAVLWPDRLLR